MSNRIKEKIHYKFRANKMFKKKSSKINVRPPKPPTKAEILEDLETFCVDHVFLQNARRLSTASLAASVSANESTKPLEEENGINLDDWWLKFETFLTEIDEMEVYQKQFDVKKKSLKRLDGTIQIMSDDIQLKISENLEKVLNEVADDDNDLK